MTVVQNISEQASRRLARRKFFLTFSVLVAFFLALSAPSIQGFLLFLLVSLLAGLRSPSNPPHEARQLSKAWSDVISSTAAAPGGTITPRAARDIPLQLSDKKIRLERIFWSSSSTARNP